MPILAIEVAGTRRVTKDDVKTYIRERTAQAFSPEALAKDVLYVPGELCYANDPTRRKPENAMRISFGGGTEQNIQLGIERLGGVLREMLGK